MADMFRLEAMPLRIRYLAGTDNRHLVWLNEQAVSPAGRRTGVTVYTFQKHKATYVSVQVNFWLTVSSRDTAPQTEVFDYINGSPKHEYHVKNSRILSFGLPGLRAGRGRSSGRLYSIGFNGRNPILIPDLTP